MVTLNNATPVASTYTVATSDNLATVQVKDYESLPLIEISAPSDPIRESIGSVNFEISASSDLGTMFRVRYDPSEVSSDFLNNTGDPSQEDENAQILQFSGSAGDYSAILRVPIDNDSTGERTGQIQVTLLPDDAPTQTYRVKSNGEETVMATILDDDAPELKIAAVGPVTEAPNAKAQFIVTSQVPIPSANHPLPVYYTPVSTNFIQSGSGQRTPTPTSLTFSGNGPYTAPLEIEVHNDDIKESDGTIIVTLEEESTPGTKYTVAEAPANSDSVAVTDDDSLPLLTITAPTTPVAESDGMVNFEISAETNLGTSFRVRYDPSEVDNGDFLDENASTNQEEETATQIAFSGSASPYTGTLSVPIHDDSTSERTGQIQVTLLPDDEAIHTYRVKSDGSQTVMVTILDDDAPELKIFAGSAVVEGDGNTADFTITSQVPIPTANNPLTLNYIVSGGDFIESGIGGTKLLPYTFSTQSPYTTTISIPIAVDTQAEPDGEIVIILEEESTPGTTYFVATTPDNTATVGVTDDDSAPLVTITAPSDPVPESTGMVEFGITATRDLGSQFRVRYQASEVNSGDFLNANATPTSQEAKTFALLDFTGSGNTYNATLPIPIHDDDNSEPTGEIQVTLLQDDAPTETYRVASDGRQLAKVTIWDDDAPELTISAGTDVTEGTDDKATFTITSNVMPKSAIPIQYTATSAGFIANSGTKVTANPAISFVKNDTTGKYEGAIEIDIVNDDLNEPSGTLQITLNNETTLTTYYVDTADTTKSSAEVAVTDDDPTPTVSVANLSPIFEESTGTITIPVTLSNPTTETVMIDWSTNTGTATANDFVGQTNQTLVISDGTKGDIEIDITPDNESEEIENFTVVLTNARGATLENDITVEVSIIDQELPNLEFTNPTFSVPENGNEIIVTVELTTPAIVDVTFTYEIIAGTATAIEDYNIPSNLAGVISKNGRSNSITILINNDTRAEGNESFIVRLKELNGANFASGTTLDANVTIVDDEALVLSFKTTNFETNESIGESGFNVEIQITNVSSVKVTFDISLNGGTAINGTDYNSPTNLQGEIAIGSTSTTITIPITDDEEVEENETFNLTISNLVNAIFASGGTSLVQEITIVDDDGKIQISVVEGNSPIDEGMPAIFTLNATGVDLPVTVEYNVTQRGNFVLWRTKRTLLVEESPQTLEIATHNDEVPETEGAIIVTLVNPQNFVSPAPGNSAEVVVRDDDTLPDGSQQTEPEDRISVASLAVNMILNDLGVQVNSPVSTKSRAPSLVLPTISIDAVQTIVSEGSSDCSL